MRKMMRLLVWFKGHLRIVLIISIVAGCAPAYLHAYSISQGGISEVPTILAGDMVLVNTAAYELKLTRVPTREYGGLCRDMPFSAK